MCFMCAATSTFDPARHADDADFATIWETTDAPYGTTTPYTISVGDTFSGYLSPFDWGDAVAITLVAGQTYTLTLDGSGVSPLGNPFVELYNSGFTLIGADNDGGAGNNSSLTFTAGYSGTYYLVAYSYQGASSGDYNMSITTGGTPPTPTGPGTLDQLANYLTDGYWNDTNRLGRSFNTDADNTITVNLTSLTAQGRALARWALEVWETVVDLNFAETSGSADITFDDSASGAFASSSVSGSTILSSDINVSTAWLASSGTQIGTYSLQTYIHEIGHALGLGHQGYYNGSASYGTDETFSNDSWQLSVMSYFHQTENTTTNASFAYLVSLMMADVIAGQNLYGASSVTNGDTIWGANTNLTGYWATLFGELYDGVNSSSVANNDMAYTIFDNDGTDTFDLSTSTSSNLIDLRGGQFSNVNGLIGNVGIALGSVIENFIGGSGNDTVTGNDADNIITGGGGNDSIDGGAGDDTAVIDQTRGSVTVVDLGNGSVRITSSFGTDTYHNIENFSFSDGTVSLAALLGGFDVTNGDDTVDGTADGDEIDALVGNDLVNGLGGNDTLMGGAGFDTLLGGEGNDTLIGGEHADSLVGGDGHDRLEGGNGFDNLHGGLGNDTLISGATADRLYGGEGNDVLIAGSNYGITVDGLFGEEGNDSLYGEGGFDFLDGGSGDDYMNGGHQADNLYGRSGNDTMYGDEGLDRLFGGADDDVGYGGNGNDGLFGEQGNDWLSGDAGNDRFFGGTGNDTLLGGADNDTLYGGAGFDTLDGGIGNDVLEGNFNADRFVFEDGHGNDTITDFAATNIYERIDMSGLTEITDLSDLLTNHATQVGGNVVIDTGAGNSITLLGVNLGDLDATDFVF